MDCVRKGDRIRLIEMPNDPDPIPSGSEGLVIEVTEGPLAQIIVKWIGMERSLALIPGVDRFEIVESFEKNPNEEDSP